MVDSRPFVLIVLLVAAAGRLGSLRLRGERFPNLQHLHRCHRPSVVAPGLRDV